MRTRRKKTIPGQLSLLAEVAFCKTCGRQLVGADSVKRCYGPHCWAKRKGYLKGHPKDPKDPKPQKATK